MTTIPNNPYSSESSDHRSRDVMKGEMSAKTTYQRSAKGPVAIAECSPDGKSITLENTGRKDETLGGWSVKRNIDGSDKSDTHLPSDFVLRPGAKVKLWARGSKPLNAAMGDIEVDESNFGSGANINTRLINPTGEDRATHVQKTIYTYTHRPAFCITKLSPYWSNQSRDESRYLFDVT